MVVGAQTRSPVLHVAEGEIDALAIARSYPDSVYGVGGTSGVGSCVWFGRSPPRGGDSRGWGPWWASGRDAWFGVRSGAGVPRAGVLVPSRSTTTTATGGSPARRRGRTGLPRSLGRIPRIGTCGTRTRMAWCASSRREGRSPFSHLGPRSFLTMHYPDRPRQIDAVSNGRAAPGQREATDGPRKSGKRN